MESGLRFQAMLEYSSIDSSIFRRINAGINDGISRLKSVREYSSTDSGSTKEPSAQPNSCFRMCFVGVASERVFNNQFCTLHGYRSCVKIVDNWRHMDDVMYIISLTYRYWTAPQKPTGVPIEEQYNECVSHWQLFISDFFRKYYESVVVWFSRAKFHLGSSTQGIRV